MDLGGNAEDYKEGGDVVAFQYPVFRGPQSAAAPPAENDWRAAIEARLASLESEIAKLKAGRLP